MKFTRLIVRNLCRSRLRTGLTTLLIAGVFFFIATIVAIVETFDKGANTGVGLNRLVVQSATSLANPLPFAHESKISEVPGVSAVSKLQWVGGCYQKPENFFPNYAVDHDKMHLVWDDYRVGADQMEAFRNDRQGAVVGPEIAKRFGWRVGDRITLIGQIFPFDAELNIRGIYEHEFDTSSLFFHFDYFHESTKEITGAVAGMYWLKVKDERDLPDVAQRIDALFENSDHPTQTFTEKEFQQQFMSMIGDVNLLFTIIGIGSILMLCLLVSITLGMAARERVQEIAVLKAIGFPGGLILWLMLVEFGILGLVGGLLGSVGARVVYSFVNMAEVTQGFLIGFGVSGRVMLVCVLAGGLVGLIAGGLPAAQSARLSVTNGLRKVW